MITKNYSRLQIRNSFRYSLRSSSQFRGKKSDSTHVSADSFSSSLRRNGISFGSKFSQKTALGQYINNIQDNADPIGLKSIEITSKRNLEELGDIEKRLNNELSKGLEKMGVPGDVSFEYDYNFDSGEISVTKISDENYRESVEAVLNKCGKSDMSSIAYASRIMNGNISSAYYTEIAQSLKDLYGQDMSKLYVDKRGNLCGANAKLQAAIADNKRGTVYGSLKKTSFPANDIEGVLKRLVSDKKITPNVSHMGYDGKGVYTNDGEFKFGKDYNKKLLGETRYMMRGSVALKDRNGYDSWLVNEKLF